MTSAASLGWRKDRPGDDKPGHHLLMAAKASKVVEPLDNPSLFLYRGPRVDQGNAGSCVAHAAARCLQLLYSAADIEAPFASRRQLYYDGRREEWAGQPPSTVPPLQDTGIEPRLMMTSLQGLGYVPESLCPYTDDPKKGLNDQPAPELYEKAYDASGLDYARIYLVGQQAIDQTSDALTHRMPVMFGMQVDNSFMDNHGERIISINGSQIVGGHMLAILAVLNAALIKSYAAMLPRSAQPGDILFDNWWGLGDTWGNDLGLGVMSGSLFGGAWIDDRYIFRNMPLPEIE